MPVTPIPLRPYPLPPSSEDAAALTNFYKGGRTWLGSLDTGSNAVAAAVLAADAAAGDRVGKGKAVRGGSPLQQRELTHHRSQKLQLPDKSLYLCGFDRVSHHRRQVRRVAHCVLHG